MDTLPSARFLSQELRRMPGVRRAFPKFTPAAGAEWSVNVPGGCQWRLIGGTAHFLASGAVANRFPGIQFTSLGVPVWRNFFNNNLAAGSNKDILYELGTTFNISASPDGGVPVVFEPILLVQGDTMASTTVALDALDQYSNVQLVVEEFQFTNQDLSEIAFERDAEHDALERAFEGALTPTPTGAP